MVPFSKMLVFNGDIKFFFFLKKYLLFLKKNHAETPILKDFFFHFCSKWSPFSKMLIFNGDINFFFKEVSSVFEKCQFLGGCFLLVKNNILCKKRQFLGKCVNF